jgi:rSAM/selenodomain-associated transferase 2/rSAM/selenodomain-associated transferase 1
MTTPQIPKSDLVILFCRYPVPGQVKTRLIPALGPTGAANLHLELTETILKTLVQGRVQMGFDLQIRFDGGSSKKMSQWLGSEHVYEKQGEGDLGRRMYGAFHDAFRKGYQRVILIGSDIPDMKAGHIRAAFHALEHNDLVLAPSTDGGYWLVGLKRPADIFQITDWGTHNVLEQTMAQAKAHGLSIQQIEPLSDIDTIEDLRIWRPEYETGHPYLSIIIPTLNEADHIELTLEKALNKEAEVIVVDGESRDDTTRRAEKGGARVASSPPGRAVQLNRGADMAKGDVLFFLHADTHPPDHFVEWVFRILMNQGTIAGAFRFKTDLDHPLMKVIEIMTNIRSRVFSMPYGDQGLFLSKKGFDALGGFPDVPIAEDLHFVRRLSKHGRIHIAPVPAVTSARRWRQKGFVYTIVINAIILMGCLLGMPPERFASLYD